MEATAEPEVRKTPMRGEGRRRLSQSSADAVAGPSVPAVATLREGGVRRKPVPSTVMEADSPTSAEYIDQIGARSSVARGFDREGSPPTPGEDDTPYIRFALDQLTRDEEVSRESRRYPGAEGAASNSNNPYAGSLQQAQARDQERYQTRDQQQDRRGRDNTGIEAGAAELGVPVHGGAALAGAAAAHRQVDPPASQQWPDPSRPFDEPPPRNPRRLSQGQVDVQPRSRDQDPDMFTPVSNEGRHQAPLSFLPGILRPIQVGLFLLLLIVILALLLVCAIWSLVHKGLWAYGSFGDGSYFVFQYLPTMLGMLLFLWLVQIEVAVYRIAPFIAMASSVSPRSREEGARLSLYKRSFIVPDFGHFRAKQAVVGVFMLTAWLQIWTLPLLGSSFNVYYFGGPNSGTWRWVATTGAIWAVIGLYIILLVAVVVLLFWLRKQETGLRWDPRSLADMIVLLERSNALTLTEDEELRHDAPRLGYWRTSHGSPNDVFHTYGITSKPARRYSLEDGRLREKVALPQPEPKSRFSDLDELEMGREQRHSREKMLPKHLRRSDDEDESGARAKALPWFLRPSAALLWIIVAIVLLLAFLIVSYLPSTRVSRGFMPGVQAPVNKLGFSGTNFLYSIVPAFLATICFLGWLDIDFAYRRLQPYTSLVNENGEYAEKSILLAYTADMPGFVTASAAVNGQWRVAICSFISLVASTLPILAGGVFWAQFYVPKQQVRISAHMPGYIALTVFVSLYAFAFLVVFPDRRTRSLDHELPAGNRISRFVDIVSLVHQSRMLEDVAFHAPLSKTDLVTRLLSAQPGAAGGSPYGRNADAAASKLSLADSVRGFGRARMQAQVQGAGMVPRYALGGYSGRDGKDYTGVDRVRT